MCNEQNSWAKIHQALLSQFSLLAEFFIEKVLAAVSIFPSVGSITRRIVEMGDGTSLGAGFVV